MHMSVTTCLPKIRTIIKFYVFPVFNYQELKLLRFLFEN